jgi:L-fuculose-phosphate aldolase
LGNKRNYLINQIVKYCQIIDRKGFAANHDGNITVKFGDLLLATPTAVSKGDILPEIIITLDAQGNKIDGIGKPFSEIKLHLAAYAARAEAQAVVHAHPPFATARGLLNLPLQPMLPEAIVSLGAMVPVVPFALPGAKENDEIIAQAFAEYDAVMLPGNGVLAIGESIEQAYLRLELVEHLAKIYFYAEQAGQPLNLLSESDIQKLLEKRAAAGLGPKKKPDVITPTTPALAQTEDATIEALKKMILAEIDKMGK